MNIFEHIKQADCLTQESKDLYDYFNNTQNFRESVISSKNVYWTHNNPWDLQNDSDFDGIPDALDYNVGPGAY